MSRVLKQAQGAVPAGGADPAVADIVAAVISDVRAGGDGAVRRYSAQFDDWSPVSFRLSEQEISKIVSTVPDTVLDDLRFAQRQVQGFAQAQRDSIRDFEVETLDGVFLGQRNLPVDASGAYVPGGRYPLTASAHMTVLTAKVAGVGRVAATTPPSQGAPPPISVAAMHLAGADEIYVLGGVQAVAALALGTETIAPVNILTGPGNAYVAEAKRQLFGEVGIDLFAGPTETLIVADDHADPFTVAVDLLSQAEHGPDSPCVLITTSETVGRATLRHVEELLPGMPTGKVAAAAWRGYGEVHVAESLDEAFALADAYASEHVQILTENPRRALASMSNFGALFLGERTCVPYGDKLIGTNHVLPTRGAARYTGGLWVGKFLKTVTYQEVREDLSSAQLGKICGRLSRLEQFEGHARSGDLRAARFAGAELPWAEMPIRPQSPCP
ncbi:histidinol dehydrogenase [Streptomyces sp. NEAU-YJ-81]|uniref:histidinol dehydrogenase n=1 Tax=Streptomyces sp. NEAU-YJ-81 TaxID=2820288 RepID=UPI001ABD1828|nr:histidinol dehydrogenase [Streptomyces sp. NEAU-YJ-81]MBO3682135.1 histidinol dehydrogenase [Streptomyces sp. NEAU-YJ-81]